jgi:hypothetical protein
VEYTTFITANPMTFSSSTAMEEHAVPLSKCYTDDHAQLFNPESENTNPFQGESKFNASAEGAEHQSQTDSQKKKKKKKAKNESDQKVCISPNNRYAYYTT